MTQGGPYDVILAKKGWENSGNVGGWIAGYLCSCLWGQYHSGEPSSGFGGRFCSHCYATMLVANARARSEFMNDRTASRNMNMICRCERCGEVSNVGDDMMCETCSQQTAFEAIASVAFGCGGKKEAGMVSRMNPDRVADICDEMSVCDLGGGAKMAMWRGLKAVFSSDRKTATRFFAGYEQEELQDENMGAIARNTDRRKRASW